MNEHEGFLRVTSLRELMKGKILKITLISISPVIYRSVQTSQDDLLHCLYILHLPGHDMSGWLQDCTDCTRLYNHLLLYSVHSELFLPYFDSSYSDGLPY